MDHKKEEKVGQVFPDDKRRKQGGDATIHVDLPHEENYSTEGHFKAQNRKAMERGGGKCSIRRKKATNCSSRHEGNKKR